MLAARLCGMTTSRHSTPGISTRTFSPAQSRLHVTLTCGQPNSCRRFASKASRTEGGSRPRDLAKSGMVSVIWLIG